MFGAIDGGLLLELAKEEGFGYQEKPEPDLGLVPYVFVKPEHLSSTRNGYDIINSNGQRTSFISSEDHPNFRDTRRWLKQNGYIKCEHRWLNGDRVIKPFFFNNVYMDVGEKFGSACAMYCGYSELYNDGLPLTKGE